MAWISLSRPFPELKHAAWSVPVLPSNAFKRPTPVPPQLERKLLPAAWVRKLNAIHAEMARVAPALEEAERCYPLAATRLEELAATAEKTFLGGFKGEAGSWQKIVKAYERDGAFVERGS